MPKNQSNVFNNSSSDDSLDRTVKFRFIKSFEDIKTESTRKLSIFNFQRTKTLYQNNLKNIASLFQQFQELKM